MKHSSLTYKNGGMKLIPIQMAALSKLNTKSPLFSTEARNGKTIPFPIRVAKMVKTTAGYPRLTKPLNDEKMFSSMHKLAARCHAESYLLFCNLPLKYVKKKIELIL